MAHRWLSTTQPTLVLVHGGHVVVMEVSGLLDGGDLVEATTAIVELLVAELLRNTVVAPTITATCRRLSRSSNVNVLLRSGSWFHNSQWEKSSNQTGFRWQFPRWTQCQWRQRTTGTSGQQTSSSSMHWQVAANRQQALH